MSEAAASPPSKTRMKKFNPFSKRVSTEEVVRSNSIAITQIASPRESKVLHTRTDSTSKIGDIKEIPLDSSWVDASKNSSEETKTAKLPEIKEEEKKFDYLTNEINILPKDYITAENNHKAIEENLKKTIEELTAESAKFRQDNEKSVVQIENIKKQFSDLEQQDAKKSQELAALKEEINFQAEKIKMKEQDLQDSRSKIYNCEAIIVEVNLKVCYSK